MVEEKALAYVNMYGVLASLENLCELDSKAKEELQLLKKPYSLCFSVKDGPCCTFTFSKSGCVVKNGEENANGKMTFNSCKKFNEFISASKPGVPVKGIVSTLTFLLGTFTKLTNRLNDVLRPKESDLANKDFFELNTLMTMYVIAGSISALANNDSISKISAGNTVDGNVEMSIPGKCAITINVSNHQFTTIKSACDNPRAVMKFASVELAHGLFNGQVSTINEMCKGTISLAGMISMIDNVNRILDRVAVYLA